MKKMMFSDRYGLTDAVIEKRKTVTRRLPSIPKNSCGGMEIFDEVLTTWDCNGYEIPIKPPYNVGEIVAVAQSYKDAGYANDAIFYLSIPEINGYAKQTAVSQKGWSNKMFVAADLMPHQIRILDVRAEKLQDITDEDCEKEGVKYFDCIDNFYFEDKNREEGFYFSQPRKAYATLIDKISGKGTWDSNPFVWVYEFELIKTETK